MFLCIIYSCSHYDNGLEGLNKSNSNGITTVTVEEAKAYLNNNELFKTGEKGKGDTIPLSTNFVTLFQDQINHEPLINSDQKMTVIPAVIAYPKYYSRVVLFRLEDRIIARVFNMKRDQSSTDKNFTGVILITDLEGNFSSAYNVKDGSITHYLVYKIREQNNKGVVGFIPDDPIDGGILDPVKVDGSSSSGQGGIRDVWLAYGPQTGSGANSSNSGSWHYGGGSSGAGTNNPEEAATNPCKEMKKKADDAEFKGKLNEISENLNLNYETGYLMTTNGTSTAYEAIEGDPNKHEIELSPTNPISGYMHTHVVGDSKTGYSTFSMADVKAIYDIYKANKMQDHASFVAGVVSTHGTSYTLMINDISSLISFGATYLSTDSDFYTMENLYDKAFEAVYPVFMPEIKAREFALLSILEGSGLKLMKGNSDFSQWGVVNQVGMNINISNCN
ncbi:hypothetical protein KO02_09655 [Sphingobacterium sp. ML3W]|nr:hypothetical protein KO02_09655 [Sphingobacterium sp. ML3W]